MDIGNVSVTRLSNCSWFLNNLNLVILELFEQIELFKERITAHTHLIFLFLQDVGYNFARPYFQAMIQTEKLRKVLRPPDKVSNRLSTQKLIPETSSLTDLANMMSSADMSDITEPITVFDITHALGKSKQRCVLPLETH